MFGVGLDSMDTHLDPDARMGLHLPHGHGIGSMAPESKTLGRTG